MSEGIILVLVIILFFGLMYLFAYVTTGFKDRQIERRRHKKLQQDKLREAQMHKDHQERLHQIDMNYEVANKRSEEIKREIERLQAMKNERD